MPKVKRFSYTHSPLGYQCFYVVMSRIFCYTVLVGLPTSIYKRKGVSFMNFIISFTLSVAAGVVSYYICKWLDDQFKAGKALILSKQEAPSVFALPRGLLVAAW